MIAGFDCESSLNDFLKPNHKKQEQIVNDVLNYYEYFKSRYIKKSNGITLWGGYYVLAGSTVVLPEDWIEMGVNVKK